MADIKDTLDGSEDILLVDTRLASLVQVVGKDVEKQLRVGISVDVAMGILVQELTKLCGVDQVSVLNKKMRKRVRQEDVSAWTLHPPNGPVCLSVSKIKVIFPWLPLVALISSFLLFLEGRPGSFLRFSCISGLQTAKTYPSEHTWAKVIP